MIYTVSKKLVLLLVLFGSVGFSFADINIPGIWSAEGRDEGMIRPNIQDFSCKMKDGACCKGNVCAQSFVTCIQGTLPVVRGCSEGCMPIVSCEKGKILNEGKTKEERVRENLSQKFNIKTENKTNIEVLKEVKDVKVEKINNVGTKLEDIIQKTENLNYDSSKLKNYVQNLNNIKYGLNQDNLTIAEKKRYNAQLKNTINNIKQELNNIKKTYK